MYRIIIVDDEPLILAGIASLIIWENYDCTIVGKATNGPSAFDMITTLHPDIVITDIRMPVLNGLELVEKCKAHNCTFAFIVLTNLEEFQLVKKALSLGASDYLVKIDLNEEALVDSLGRAKEACELLVSKKQHLLLNDLLKESEGNLAKSYLNSLLHSGELAVEIPDELSELYKNPFALIFSLRPINISFDPGEDPYDFHQISKQIIDILSGIAARFFSDFALIAYHEDAFALVAVLKADTPFKESTTDFCNKIIIALKTYFELSAVFGVSSQKKGLAELQQAILEAQTALDYYYFDSTSSIVFYQGQQFHLSHAKDFNINVFKKDLSASISQNDSEKLYAIFQQIISLFTENKPSKSQAASACINLYTYLYSFFETGDNSYADIFPYTSNIAEHLTHLSSLSDILTWLQSFCEKLCRFLNDRKSTRSDKLIEQAKAYVNAHYKEKLALADLADNLNISAGYLSNTFKKFTGITLSDYIATIKVEHAKELIDTHQYLMYEISDMLGFDNPYYFSKVFKKITGISPREHENRKML